MLWGGLPGERNWKEGCAGLPRKSESGARLWAAALEGRGLGVRRQPSGEMEAAVGVLPELGKLVLGRHGRLSWTGESPRSARQDALWQN